MIPFTVTPSLGGLCFFLRIHGCLVLWAPDYSSLFYLIRYFIVMWYFVWVGRKYKIYLAITDFLFKHWNILRIWLCRVLILVMISSFYGIVENYCSKSSVPSHVMCEIISHGVFIWIFIYRCSTSEKLVFKSDQIALLIVPCE